MNFQGKTPIVVGDGRGFFTSRVFGALVMEAARMVGEGVDPVAIERAAGLAGFPGQPLAMIDEVSLTLPQKIEREAERLAGDGYVRSPAMRVLDDLVALGRTGKAAGAGFYDYPESGAKQLWPGLAGRYGERVEVPLADIEDRLTFAMSLETAKVFDEGILRSVADANVGSLLGIGFPPLLGGALQHIDGYESATGRTGAAAFVARADELAGRYGAHLAPSDALRERAAEGRTFRG